MIDLHIHFLPGVDDGPETQEEAVAMCRMAADSGCEILVATPHQRREWDTQDPKRLTAILANLRDAVGTEPELRLGAEVRVGAGFLEDLESPDRGGLLPLAGSDCILIEFAESAAQHDVESIVHEIGLIGYRPIIAHPELIPVISESSALPGHLVELGARFQVTGMSVTGDFGRPKQRIVSRWIDSGQVHFVASDAHSVQWRPPGLAAAYAAVEKTWGAEAARRLMVQNPRAVLDSAPVPA